MQPDEQPHDAADRFKSEGESLMMPSTRRGRKHSKWNSQTLAQREIALDSAGSSDVIRAVPSEERQRFPVRRAALAAEFAAMSPAARQRSARHFKGRLRQICASDLECRGFWLLKFEPLLDHADTMPAETSERPRPAPTEVPRDHLVEAAIEQLVASRPGVMSQKTCSQVLAGSDSRKVNAAGLHQSEHFGRLCKMNRATINGHIASALNHDRINRGTDGLLRPS